MCHPFPRNTKILIRKTIDQSLSYHICQRFLKGSSIGRLVSDIEICDLFMWFQKESQLAAFAFKNDWVLEKISWQRGFYWYCSNGLSKAFDTINTVYCKHGFLLPSPKFMQSY